MGVVKKSSTDPFAKKSTSSTSGKTTTPVKKGDYTDYGITMHLGDTQESIDLATGKPSKNWNTAKIRTNNEDINRLATELKFDPSKWEGKDVNEKFQRFLYSNPLEGSDFKTLIDTEHGTDPGVGHGTPQFSGKMFDGFLGTRWLDAISKIKHPEIPPAEEVKKTSEGPQRQEPGAYTRGRRDAPWWIQDVINTASAAGTRFGLKKYLPWAPQVHLQTPTPTFYDPTRELASNAEQMQIGTQGAGMFAGPQAYNARFSQIAGQGAKNAANILANYHNKNVGEANRFETIRTDILNKNNMLNADTAKKLYDGTTIANQQFDNAKRQANAELRGAYTNAITNRAMTQTMNTMYPNFQVDPRTGGMLDFYKGSPLDEDMSQTDIDKIDALAARWGDRDAAMKFYGYGDKQDRGTKVNIQQNPAFAAYQIQQQRMGQPQFGYNPNGYDDQG